MTWCGTTWKTGYDMMWYNMKNRIRHEETGITGQDRIGQDRKGQCIPWQCGVGWVMIWNDIKMWQGIIEKDKARRNRTDRTDRTGQDRRKEYEWKGQEGRGQYGYDAMLFLSLPPSPPSEQGR
jgi:hypothetical protein